LGGGIGFGERSRDALLREIREEIGAEVEKLELVGVLENIFIYEGAQGHEIVFVYDAEFKDRGMYERGEIQGYEVETDAGFVARWQSPEEIKLKNIRLVPEGLADLLRGWKR
jgi:ADP-ribose pyrophosphatase YjhB (NUDIX family)